MNIGNTIGDFLLSTWLWQITFNWFHPIVTGVVMFFMMRLVMRKARTISCAVSLGAQCFALIGFGAVMATGVSEWLLGTSTVSYGYVPQAPSEFYASLSLAIVYVVFQSIYFAVGSLWCHYKLVPYLLIVLMSNSIGMMLSFVLTRMVIAWHYVG